MGTLIQSQPLKASDFFLDDSLNSYGSYEVLNLTRGDLIFDIHYSYLRSGADIIETNTFGANRFSLKQYNLENYVYDLNLAGAEIAKAAAQEFFLATNKEVFVAGTIGPSSKSASFSPSVDNPSYRPYVFDDFVEAFEEQAEGLIDGNVDLILIETVFDTLVAKAAIVATLNVLKRKQKEIDIMVSATFSDKSGRTLSGQTLKAFVDSLSSYPLFSLGLNCSTGIKEMAPLIKELASYSPFRLSAHPNAGFPDEDGLYSQSAEQMSSFMKSLLDEGLLNIVGGCCGTNEKHIKALSEVAKSAPVRPLPPKRGTLRLSGLEPLKTKNDNFIIIGERTNVAGSRKFARLIKEKAYVEALAIAAQQVEDGANLIDICMDDPLIDSQQEMGIFLRLAQSDPNIAKVPFMIDSSQWSTLEVALKEIQGRGIVNSISLKEGEEIFIKRGKFIDKMGFAMVVMLFDEKGQADTFERKIEIAKRSYTLLVENNIAPNSIIFDPNVLSIATGIDEHDYYAIDFIRAAAWIKANLKGAFVSGGISNLSFSFRGNNSLREIIHAIFLHHSVKNGLDMAIVNPKTLLSIDNIDKETFTVVESVILANQKDVVASRQKLIELALKPINVTSVEKKEEIKNHWR
jgi:5-methyltetrahydrofolate--homocysteine methyltransferase